MYKGNAAGVERNAPIRVRTGGPVLQVAFDGASYRSQLGSNLVVASGFKVYFEQPIAIGAAQYTVVQYSLFGILRSEERRVG